MHTLITLIVLWAAIITQEAPGPVFEYVETDPSLRIAQVIVVDQEGAETVFTPDHQVDYEADMRCTWHKLRWVDCRDFSGDPGPARVDYYLRPAEYRQFVPVVAHTHSRTTDLLTP